MKRKTGNTLNHTLTAKGSMAEFEIWFVKEFGREPKYTIQGFSSEKWIYAIKKCAAKRAWLARERIY